MTTEDIFEYVKAHQGERLRTPTFGQGFCIACEPGVKVPWRIQVHVESSGKARRITNRRILEDVLVRYEKTHSLNPSDYRDIGSVHVSYILPIIERIANQRGLDL